MFEKALQGVQVDAWESLRTTDVIGRGLVSEGEGLSLNYILRVTSQKWRCKHL